MGADGEVEKQALESLIRSPSRDCRMRRALPTGRGQPSTETRDEVILIHKCLNLLGNYLSSQFESREMQVGSARL